MRSGLSIAILFLLVNSGFSQAEEYFGKFSDGPDGRFIDAVAGRPRFRLLNEFKFDDPNGLIWSVPKDTEVDGASIPQAFWTVIGGPFDGEYLNASVIHDYYCDKKTRTAHDTHRNFYYGMRAKGVSSWKADAMHWAVSTFGPDWRLEKRVINELQCDPTNDTSSTCTNVQVLKDIVVETNMVDLSDPEVLAVAIGKFNAIAKTLKTTDGKTLDVSASGNIDATIPNIESNAAFIRQKLATKAFRSDPKVLGLILEPSHIKLNDIQNWPGNKVPSFSSIGNMDEIRSPKDQGNDPFILRPKDVDNFRTKLDMSPTKFTIPQKLNQ